MLEHLYNWLCNSRYWELLIIQEKWDWINVKQTSEAWWKHKAITDSLTKDKWLVITCGTIFYPPLINSRYFLLYTGYSVISNRYVDESFTKIPGIWPIDIGSVQTLTLRASKTFVCFFNLCSAANIAFIAPSKFGNQCFSLMQVGVKPNWEQPKRTFTSHWMEQSHINGQWTVHLCQENKSWFSGIMVLQETSQSLKNGYLLRNYLGGMC